MRRFPDHRHDETKQMKQRWLGSDVVIPDALIQSQYKFAGAAGKHFIAQLPVLIESYLHRWQLTITGACMHGMAALVLPVNTADGSAAVIKFQVLDDETAGEPIALTVWNGNGSACLLEDDPGTGTMLLQRLGDPMSAAIEQRRLSAREGVVTIAELLARLTAFTAPAQIRRLQEIAEQMLDELPFALKQIRDPGHRRIVTACGRAVSEVVNDSKSQLLHWDLHFDNVLAGQYEPWLAIDPKPLAGDPGFDLLPAIDNLFDPAEVLWRFDAMTQIIGLDRPRAKAWTLGRVMQNALWNIQDGEPPADDHLDIARQLLAHR